MARCPLSCPVQILFLFVVSCPMFHSVTTDPPTPLTPACTPPHDYYRFCDTTLSIADRVTDLLKRIPDVTKPNLLTARGGHGKLQNFSDIGVPPYYWGTNCLHSVGAGCINGRCPTNFPSGPSMAATFDRALMLNVSTVWGRELRALYNLGVAKGLDCWGPVINLNRDPRWGRNGEGGAEDPYLMGEYAAAYTKGFQYQGGEQSTTKYLTAILTVKHFVANSVDNSIVRQTGVVDGHRWVKGQTVTRHTMNVTVSNAQLQEYLAAFRAATREGVKGMMCSYNSVNGIPTCLSPMLKSARELWAGRKPWGGYITSDSDSVADAVDSHHYVTDRGNASCLAIRDGGDDIDSGDTFADNLLNGVKAGFCTMDDVDSAVRNSLTVRFELGLFDPPSKTGSLAKLGETDVGTSASAELNLRASAESLVLLKNRQKTAGAKTLPLKPGAKIAVIGPHANASRFLIQVDTGKICGGDGTFDCVESPFEAVNRLNVGGQTTMAVGCDIINQSISTPALKAEALTAARAADTVILAIGIGQCGCMGIADTYMGGKTTNPGGCATSVVPPYTPWGNCWDHSEADAGKFVGAEGHDKILIDLPPVQRELATSIFALNKTVVLMVLNGGSIDIGPELAASDAAIDAFYPGTLGAGIVANSIFGVGSHFNRWGRMPFTTYPASFVDEAPMMEHDLSAAPGRTYQYYTGQAVVPFGFGLSFSTWSIATDTRSRLSITTDGSVAHTVSVSVANHGPYIGDMVVTAFFVPKALTTQPFSKLKRKLWSFRRAADVVVGETVQLEFKVSAEALALFDIASGDIVSVPGHYDLVFDSGDGVNVQTVGLVVTGPQQVIEPFPVVPTV